MLNEELNRLIAANKASEAITIMTEIINDKDENMSKDLVLLSARLTLAERSNMNGSIKFEDYQTSTAQISHSVLEYIDLAEKEGYFKGIKDIESLKERRVE